MNSRIRKPTPRLKIYTAPVAELKNLGKTGTALVSRLPQALIIR